MTAKNIDERSKILRNKRFHNWKASNGFKKRTLSDNIELACEKIKQWEYNFTRLSNKVAKK